jgi:hypothetical protein
MAGIGWQELTIVVVGFALSVVPFWICPTVVVALASQRQQGRVARGWVAVAALSFVFAWLVVIAWYLIGRTPTSSEL